MIEKGEFNGEFIVGEETIKRPTITVLRDNDTFGAAEKDFIICGMCGSIMSHKMKFCGGCGAKFKKITKAEYMNLKRQFETKNEIDKNQLNLNDFLD